MNDELESHPLACGNAPSWASCWGEDDRGVWVGVAVRDVVCTARWVGPGAFRMGSPSGEFGRDLDEGPTHCVVISRGFWLGEVPCTQALWTAVVGDNPSERRAPELPVDQVNWNDCAAFLDKLNELVPALRARLPSEAEWEYACRAGSEVATYAAGDDGVEPALDAIAWTSHNSDGRMRPAGRLQPNAWGLHDMLGNVFEWCQDRGSRSYPKGDEALRDPVGPARGYGRVIRGGAWNSGVRSCRAACRNSRLASHRMNGIGFRIALADTDGESSNP